jgi:hypothetical protein
MAEVVTVKHPIRGALWGLLFGIGLAFVLVFSTLMQFALVQIVVSVLIGVVFGVLWGLFGAAKAPKGPPPEAVAAEGPSSSRFDDITESAAPHSDAADAGPPQSAD